MEVSNHYSPSAWPGRSVKHVVYAKPSIAFQLLGLSIDWCGYSRLVAYRTKLYAQILHNLAKDNKLVKKCRNIAGKLFLALFVHLHKVFPMDSCPSHYARITHIGCTAM